MRAALVSMRGMFQRRIAGPLSHQLKQGVTPSRLATSLALGVVLSILPIPGTTTLICAIAALALRLNPVSIQVANFAATPLAVASLLPFLQLGQRLFGAPPLPLTRAGLMDALSQGAPAFLIRFGGAIAHALVVWALVAPILTVALQLALRPLLVRALRLRNLPDTPGKP